MFNVAQKLSKVDINNLLKNGKTGHNCFLASVHALGRSDFGAKIISNNVRKINADEYIIRYAKINGDERFFNVTTKNHTKSDTFMMYKHYICKELNPFHAIEISWDKAVKKYPLLKNIFSRIVHPNDCAGEWNKASNFMKHFTGKTPTSIGENSILPLVFRSRKVKKILDKLALSSNKEYSFVIGTGEETPLLDKLHIAGFHYFSILKVGANEVLISDAGRPDNVIKISRKEIVHNFRCICGYFKKDFK